MELQHDITLPKDQSNTFDPTSLIQFVLRGGVLLSTVLIITGMLLMIPQLTHISSRTLLLFPKTFTQLIQGLLKIDPQAVITLGLFILIATPVIRVAASIYVFLIEKNLHYVFITLVVFLILLGSIFYVGELLGHSSSLSNIQFTFTNMLFLFFVAIAAGLLGSLVGLGGGILIVPVLTLVFHFPMYFAIGASIISVIATSSGSASTYLKEHITNMRVGMFLEIATTIGAISGAFLAGLLAQNTLSIIFGIVLFLSSMPLIFEIGEELPQGIKNDRLANYFYLNGSYFDTSLNRKVSYQVTRTWFGLLMMYIAGSISGLLGIGSGTFKVLALDVAMRLPMKVSTTTSNFMIGVTAAASVGIYFLRGDILPLVVVPIALGTLIGAVIGTKVLPHMSNKLIRFLFLLVILFSALEMVFHGIGKT